MNATISEFPKQPLPHLPNPPLTPSQPPTPVVYERVEWEYKVVKRKRADGPLKHGRTERTREARMGADRRHAERRCRTVLLQARECLMAIRRVES